MSSASPADHQHPETTPLSGHHIAPPPLPVPLTSLIGREQVLDEVGQLLDDPTIRLVTLTGSGGIGKTRVAIEMATRLQTDYAHGVCFVPLASVQRTEHVIPAVAQALGVRQSGDVPLVDTLASVLHDRHMLLVLDNFEHVLDAATPLLGDLLRVCPRIKILVTSRAALHVSAERRFAVPPLPVPEDGSLDAMLGNAATSLFIERALAVREDFTVDESSAGSVRDICSRLDGIPLAIELAAARVNVLAPREIGARLVDSLDLLTGGNRDLPERHQTMRDAIAWSYDLLSKPEQALFRRLSVFAGGFTLEAAEVVGDVPELSDASSQVVDVVASLVDHSLVRHGPGANGESRFWLLETIRQFGQECLTDHGEAATARDAHAAWYLRLGADADQGQYGVDLGMWLDRLDAERDNLHVVFAWLLERDRIEDAATLAFGLRLFLFIRGHRHEFLPNVRALLAHPRLAAPSVERGMALIVESEALFGGPVSDKSVDALREAATFYREHGERRLAFFAVESLGFAFIARDDFDRATTALEESVALARDVGEALLLSAGLNNLGLCNWTQGSVDDATAHFEESVQVARDNGLSWGLAAPTGNLGHMALNLGNHDRAETLLLESMELSASVGSRRDLSVGYHDLADLARIRGDYATAQGYLEDAVSVAQDLGDAHNFAECSMALGTIANLREMHADAVVLLRRSMVAFAELGRQADMARCLDTFVAVAVRSGDLAVAARVIGAADAVLARIGLPRTEGLQRQEHQALVSAARTALGEETFADAFAVGRAMTLDQVVADVLAFEPSGSPVPPPAVDNTSGLTPRELEVLQLLADGLTNQEIADSLFLSRRTAAAHVGHILDKLNLSSRTAAVAYAIRNGLA